MEDNKRNEALGQAPPAYEDQNVQGYGDSAKQPMSQGPPPYGPPQYMGQQQYQPLNAPGQPVYAPPGQPMYGPGGHAVVVVNPGMSDAPSSHLNLAIFVTLCCCWPIGIFAILRASACKSAIAHGDRVQAQRYSREARRLSMWALGIGIVFNILSIAIVVVIYSMYIIPSWDFY